LKGLDGCLYDYLLKKGRESKERSDERKERRKKL